MLIGYAQQNISPRLDRPVYLAGFDRDRRAQSIHDDLYARALALRDGPHTLVLCALDLMGFIRPDVMEVTRLVNAQASGIQVIIASTHVHHAPDLVGLWGPDDQTCGVDRLYRAGLIEKISGVILASLEHMQPTAAKFTSRQVPGLVKNARDPEILDNELTLAQFFHPESGHPQVTLFDFPCHPEVLGRQNPHITSDYPGVLRREVEAATGASCIFFAGALGGMLTPDVKDHSFAEAESMGKKLAAVGVNALDDTEYILGSGFRYTAHPIRFKLTNPLFKLAIRRKLLPELRDPDGWLTSEVSLVRIGGLWLAAVPGELLPRLGLAIKDEMRRAGAQVTGIIGLANDELGYILPKEDFRYPFNPSRPGNHYEETMSVSKEIGPLVVETLRELIKR